MATETRHDEEKATYANIKKVNFLTGSSGKDSFDALSERLRNAQRKIGSALSAASSRAEEKERARREELENARRIEAEKKVKPAPPVDEIPVEKPVAAVTEPNVEQEVKPEIPAEKPAPEQPKAKEQKEQAEKPAAQSQPKKTAEPAAKKDSGLRIKTFAPTDPNAKPSFVRGMYVPPVAPAPSVQSPRGQRPPRPANGTRPGRRSQARRYGRPSRSASGRRPSGRSAYCSASRSVQRQTRFRCGQEERL